MKVSKLHSIAATRVTFSKVRNHCKCLRAHSRWQRHSLQKHPSLGTVFECHQHTGISVPFRSSLSYSPPGGRYVLIVFSEISLAAETIALSLVSVSTKYQTWLPTWF
ncbi:unknown [Alces alces papillomavirus 1]|uniref:Uncharacterized protein n=1 Tax=European elk papillomavirus TaxID=2885846 RepID=Q84261_PAPVE|nr:hypothetical protein EEPVgp09 [Alces alces papillomavirus 1]AAA66857.1 unknown [Alces alces papillomavirus 1]